MKSLFKGIRKIILIVFVILVFLAGYVISDGYQMYKKVTEDVSIDEKVKEIQSKSSYVKIDDVSKEYLDAAVYQLSNNSKYTYQRQIIVIQSMVENDCLSKEEAKKLIDEIKTSKNI